MTGLRNFNSNGCKLCLALADANQSVHLVASEGLEAYLPIADMVGLSAEVERLSQRLSKLQAGFGEKAPEDVVRGV
ncbi:hypothetical protein SADUNF_Sadunf04G0062800 [Salix dunnii]|uniref:Uncharacterized protein n=1 Tax=Salix dunnii TaxID=1413687 RepID=A0A835KAS7_9ROSI|nr:hypothetical protein SADUNF_Sadunf04G0062800 [Salix dunnii]